MNRGREGGREGGRVGTNLTVSLMVSVHLVTLPAVSQLYRDLLSDYSSACLIFIQFSLCLGFFVRRSYLLLSR
jgi:hypothetical protein